MVPPVITVHDDSTLIIRDIDPYTATYNDTQEIDVKAYDGSKVIILNSSLQGSVSLYNRSLLTVQDAAIFRAYWCRIHHDFHNGSGFSAFDQSRFTVGDSKVGVINAHDRSSGRVSGSDIMEIRARETSVNVSVAATDSRVRRVHLYSPSEPVFGISEGFYSELVFTQRDGASLTLRDCDLEAVSVTSRDCDIEVSSCDVYVLTAVDCSSVEVNDCYIWVVDSYDANGVFAFTDCRVDYLNYITGEAVVKLKNCVIGRFEPPSVHSLEAVGTTIRSYYVGQASNLYLDKSTVALYGDTVESLYMEGDFNLENNSLPPFGGWYRNVTIRRTYPIQVIVNNLPAEGVEVQFYKDDALYRSVETDGEGKARVQLLFIDVSLVDDAGLRSYGNATDALLLRAAVGDEAFEQQVDVYTKTPIIIELRYTENPSLLYLVAVLCVVTIAVIGIRVTGHLII
ncbi:hypothetical protein JXL21_01825 [Candidatus Bathyarchaeota archaeon]|nr:hypothetical protein [Candidatus Bathyarchaeota archaeon]